MDKHSTKIDTSNQWKFLPQYAHIIDAKDETETLDQLVKEVAKLGFSKLNFTLLRSMRKPYNNAYVFTNYSKEWLTRYESQCYWEIDPVFTHCLSKKSPLIWNADTFHTQAQRILYTEANRYGLHAGITLPFGTLGATGMLTCAVDAKSEIMPPNESIAKLSQLTLLRDIAFDSLYRFILPDTNSDTPKLSGREKECLQWHALGKTSWEIGNILNITEACVNFHFNNIRKKFNVTQRHQAVIKAIMLGLISAY
jgi:LuxR family quorum-sensing transcriptional regulator LasR